MPEKVAFELTNGANILGDFQDSSSNKGIVFFPGFTENRYSFDHYAKSFNNDFKCWTFDLNSQGESSGNWDLREISDSIHELSSTLKDRYGLKKLGSLGNSLGGMGVGISASRENSSLDCICLTSTPSAIQDVAPPYALSILGKLPQSVVRGGTILIDKLYSRSYETHRNTTHKEFWSPEEGYKPYAQMGATKITNIKETVKALKKAPRMNECVEGIKQPILFVYGGEDSLLKIKDGNLPEKIQEMYDQVGSEEKKTNYFSWSKSFS